MSTTEEIAAPASPDRVRPERARRGRPLLMSRELVLERIRALARGDSGLFRVHHQHPGFYARARRLFGTWSGAVAAAGLDYGEALNAARARALRNRRSRARRSRRAAGD